MDIVIDTSALLSVIMAEPERDSIVNVTSGHSLIGPGSIPWEIGNAFTAMLKQGCLSVADAQRGMKIFQKIPLRYVEVDFNSAISVASQAKIYAYDAYFLDCALRHTAPLLTLDRAMTRAAHRFSIKVIGV
ncbi:MAG: type II toxin-antitoxin system VapC family toxin [Candidatus Hydrogenedentes bacterium]|nr:type II toxin-antitoxin system VapC family toxin [Candidatus Hydrogenedentota bacterium]